MPLVDPNIAMSYRGIELPNQLAQYGQVQQIKAAQNQNRMADLQMQEYERARTEAEGLRNYLSSADLADPTARAGLARFGESGLKYGKALTEQETAALTQRETKFKIAKARQDFMAQTLRDISRNPSDANITAYMEDLASSPLFSAEEKAGISSTASRILGMPIDQRGDFMASQGASASDLKPSYREIDQDGQSLLLETPATGGAPVVRGTYVKVPLPENVVGQKRDIAQAGRPEGARVYLPPQPKAEQEKRGELLVKQYGAVSDQAGIAIKTLPAIQSNLAILDKGFDTGFGTETQAAAAKVLGALGVADAEKYATNAQTFSANATQAVLQKQLEQKGPQTESDAQRITQIGAQLGNTKEANKILLTVAQEQLKRDVEQRNFYDKWWKSNKTYDGAEDAWYAGDGGKSLFDRPALKDIGKSADKREPLDKIFAKPKG